MESQRLKILIVAHELSPIKGSECAEGWNLVSRLAQYHDVTVLYASGSHFNHNSYVDAINNYFRASSPIPGLKLININKPRIAKLITYLNIPFKRLSSNGLSFLHYLGYKYWQKTAFKEAKFLHENDNFDIVHQLTLLSFREPGYMWELGIPFVWGPTGGTSNLPKEFYKLLTFHSSMIERFRTFSNYFYFNFSPRIINANKLAALIYAFSREDAIRFKKRATGEIKIMLDAGTYHWLNRSIRKYSGSEKLKGIWCGQLIERKSLAILLKALAQDQITREMIDFLIIGDGPLKKTMHEMAKSLKLNNIQWIDKVSHDEIFSLMGAADLFVHTSLREATSNVIPEALSMALPVLCHDAYGMSIAIDETCGIKIPLESPELSINGFHVAIKKLILNRKLLEELKSGAKKRATEISWDKMAETISLDYFNIINKRRSEI